MVCKVCIYYILFGFPKLHIFCIANPCFLIWITMELFVAFRNAVVCF